jgi:hypothetical protein
VTLTTDIPLGGWVDDVAISSGAVGAQTSIVLYFNQTVPVGTVLVAAIQSGGFSSVSGTDTQGNTWVSQVNSSINGASIHLVLWTCVVTTQLTTADNVTFTFTGGNTSGARTGVISSYQGVSLTTPVDSSVTDGDQANPGTSLTATASGATSQRYEVIYVAWVLQNTTGTIVWDPNYDLRSAAASVGTIRTVQPTDNVVTSIGTYNSTISWANSANVVSAMLGLQLVAVPPEVTTIPSGTEGPGSGAFLDSGTAKPTFIPSGTNTKQTTDAATVTVGFSEVASTEIYTGGGGPSTHVDSGTATLGLDPTESLELFSVGDAGTSLVNITQPFRGTPAQFVDGDTGFTSELALWNLGEGELGSWQFANSGTMFVFIQPGGSFPQVLVNPCVSVMLSRRFTLAPVGVDRVVAASRHNTITVKKNWRVVNSGKCLA